MNPPHPESPDPVVDPFLIWMWNGVLDRDLIRRQLDAFAAKGVRAVCIHPMPSDFRRRDFHSGMDVEYLSPEFFEWIAFAAEEIRRRDMILWLYDEGGWPSGSALGRVVAGNPALKAWTLVRSRNGVEPRQPPEANGCPDLMNPEAAECFIRLTHERYREAVGHLFGTTIRGVFTDEARLFGEVGTSVIPWSPCLPEAYVADHNRSLDEDLPHLFERAPGHVPAQRRYLRTVSRLVAEAWYAPIRRWCEQHGLLFEGHHNGEDDYAHHGRYFGDYLEQARRYHIPGVDVIRRQVFPGKRGGNFVILGPSSAWARGGRYALSESFAVFGAGLTLEQMHWVAAFQLVRGVNRLGIMTTLYSTEGPRRICTCHDLAPHDPRWRDADLFFAFVRRTANFMLRGRPRPTVGMYYRTELVPPEEAATFNREHEAACDRILDGFNAMMFVGREDLPSCDLRALVVHPHAPFDEDEERALNELRIPRIPAGASVDFRRFSPIAPVHGPPGVRVLPIEPPDGLDLLIFNENDAPVDVEFSSPSGSAYADFPIDEGDLSIHVHPPTFHRGRVRLHLLPWQMRALTPQASPRVPWRPMDTSVLDVSWRMRKVERFTITDAGIRRQPLESEWQNGKLGDASRKDPYFSGTIEYMCEFSRRRRSGAERVLLDLGRVCWSAGVSVNGTDVGRRAWRPFWFDISGALRDGRNTVIVRVTNTLANQWLQPDLTERDHRQWPNPYRKRVDPWLPETAATGLVGPVRLLTFG